MALAVRVDALPLLEELGRRFADRVDPDFLRAIRCDDFPRASIRLVARGPR